MSCSPGRRTHSDRAQTHRDEHQNADRLHEEFKRRIIPQAALPSSAEAAVMLSWTLLASGRFEMSKDATQISTTFQTGPVCKMNGYEFEKVQRRRSYEPHVELHDIRPV
jgi:hypothetical protein